jgi:DNA modification methylase
MKDDIIKTWLNTIQCVDCIEGLKKLPDNSIDLLIADPPYGISKKLNCKGKRLGTTAKLDFEFGEWDKFNKKWLEIAIPKIKGWFISFCAKKDLGVYWNALEHDGFIAVDAIVWQKPDPLPLNAKSRFLNAWEVAVVGKMPGATWNSNYEHNIFKFQAPKGKDRIHPTQKPLELMKKLIELTTDKGDLVIDPFMGSGTTAVACKLLKRNFIGFEIDKEYCKLATKRIEMTPTTLF